MDGADSLTCRRLTRRPLGFRHGCGPIGLTPGTSRTAETRGVHAFDWIGCGLGTGDGVDVSVAHRWVVSAARWSGWWRVSTVVFLARLGLALMFALAGVAKLADLGGARRAARGFGVPAALAGVIGTVRSLAELGVAGSLLFPGSAPAGGIAALVLIGGFVTAIAAALVRREQADCHWFGQLHSAPAGWATLARNLVFAGVAMIVVAAGPQRSATGWWGRSRLAAVGDRRRSGGRGGCHAGGSDLAAAASSRLGAPAVAQSWRLRRRTGFPSSAPARRHPRLTCPASPASAYPGSTGRTQCAKPRFMRWRYCEQPVTRVSSRLPAPPWVSAVNTPGTNKPARALWTRRSAP